MRHLHLSLRVPPHRVEELLDRIHTLSRQCGTFSITNLIDEYREDVYLVPIDTQKGSHHGDDQPTYPRQAEGERRARRNDWD